MKDLKMNNLPKPNLLVVDDTKTNIDIVLETLGKDYELSVAMSGEDALELLESLHPDLILLDILMPGMDGYDVCARLKAHKMTKKIPVIFLTVSLR